LIIYLDQQGHVIKSFGFNPNDAGNKNIVSVLKNETKLMVL
jgi:cellulose biosynthesis protein BcsQ